MIQHKDTKNSCAEKNRIVADDLYFEWGIGNIQGIWSFQEKGSFEGIQISKNSFVFFKSPFSKLWILIREKIGRDF